MQMEANPDRPTPTSMYLDTATRALLDMIAADEQRSRSQVVRRLIRAYADNKETK